MVEFKGVFEAEKLPAPSYGLFSVADVDITGITNSKWLSGFFAESEACGYVTDIYPTCNSVADDPETISDNSAGDLFSHIVGFGIHETFECDNTVGIKAVDRRAKILQKIDSISEFAVERELWEGLAAQQDDNPTPATKWLANATDLTASLGGPADPFVVLGVLETEFAQSNPGIQATVHMSPLIATVLKNSLKAVDGKLYTKTGSLVAISRGGVPESGPSAGGDITIHWVYITGPVHVKLGSEELITSTYSEIVNSVNNSVIYAAERPAAVYFDGCVWYGALADATL